MEALSTLCYIERDGQYLMLHRVSKKNDVNKDKWIGVGGHFLPGESPEECLLREVKEETGYTLTSFRFRGLVTFVQLPPGAFPSAGDCKERRPRQEAEHSDAPVFETDAAPFPADATVEYMHLFTADGFAGEAIPCDEGVLEWVDKDKIEELTLWEGDKVFLRLLADEAPFFSLKLTYDHAGHLVEQKIHV